MFKWVELSTDPYSERYACLSEQMRLQGVENEFLPLKKSLGKESWDEVKALVQGHQGIRLGRGWGESILSIFPNHAVHVSRLGAADCLIHEDGHWWPRSASYQGFLEVLARFGENFDLNSTVLVVGAGAMARTAVAVLFREGFKRFHLTAMDEGRGRALLTQMERVYLGAEFKFVPKEKLIMLPGLCGVLVNTTPSVPENELLQELSYFNFLQPRGIVIDLNFQPAVTAFLGEAQDVGAVTVPGYSIAAATDRVWTKWSCGLDLDEESYAQALLTKFQSKV